jgi:hypothetical protein
VQSVGSPANEEPTDPGAGKLGGALDVLVMDASWTTVELWE